MSLSSVLRVLVCRKLSKSFFFHWRVLGILKPAHFLMDDYHHVELLSVRNMIANEFLFSSFQLLPSILTSIVAWHCRMVIDKNIVKVWVSK